jgi:hypothetical protein
MDANAALQPHTATPLQEIYSSKVGYFASRQRLFSGATGTL